MGLDGIEIILKNVNNDGYILHVAADLWKRKSWSYFCFHLTKSYHGAAIDAE